MTDKGGATMMPTRPNASAMTMSRTTVRMGLSHLRLKEPWLDPYSQGDQDDERIESRKQAELHTGQQPHQEGWNDRQDRPHHGYQACQRASQRQEHWVRRSEQPVTQDPIAAWPAGSGSPGCVGKRRGQTPLSAKCHAPVCAGQMEATRARIVRNDPD